MSNSVHGHEVMALMVAQAQPISKPEFFALVARTFGENARFHTCSAEGLSAEELIQFLMSKGKVSDTSEGISLVAGRQCSH